MRFYQSASAASTLLALAAASPIELEPRGSATFSIQQSVRKPVLLSGPAQLASTYTKYKKAAPEDVKAAAAANDGTVTASPEEYDSEYLCPVTIGGQTLNLDFDTGSSDL